MKSHRLNKALRLHLASWSLNSTLKVDFCNINRLNYVWSPWQVSWQCESVTDCPGHPCQGQCQLFFFGCEYLQFLAQRYVTRSALFFQHAQCLKTSSWLTHDLLSAHTESLQLRHSFKSQLHLSLLSNILYHDLFINNGSNEVVMCLIITVIFKSSSLFPLQRLSRLTLLAKVTLHLLIEKEGREMSRILHEDFLHSVWRCGWPVSWVHTAVPFKELWQLSHL